MTQALPKIPGTTPFDGEQARKGYRLNKMCYSFNSAANRAEFREDEEAYMRKYGLDERQKAAIRARCVLPTRAITLSCGLAWRTRRVYGSDPAREALMPLSWSSSSSSFIWALRRG